MKRLCKNCEYWVKEEDEKGECRVHAPVPSEQTKRAHWPMTLADDRCGEFSESESDQSVYEFRGIRVL